MKLSQKTILLTGGTSGIGLALAKQLLERGNTVLITGRDANKLAAAKRALPSVHPFQSDVSDPVAIQALSAQVLAQFPTLDTLINNAGIMRRLSLRETRGLDDVTRELDTNLHGPVRMIQQFLPHLQSRPAALIVNVSSGLAFVPLPAAPVYCAAKAALHSLSLSLRFQLQGTGVTVVELAPPIVETPLYHGMLTDGKPGPKGMDPQTLARKTIAGIEAGKLEICPGQSAALRLMSRLAPRFMLRQLAKLGG